jgi:mono/diheme cytochrome c family protein
VRPATIAAGLLVCAAAAMAVAALASGGDEEERPAAPVAQATPAVERDGRMVWAQNGCGSCHTFAPAEARGEIGPDLGATLQGMPASYIRESIVEPARVAAAGYGTGTMPEDYGERIPPAEIDALVEFIHSAVRD